MPERAAGVLYALGGFSGGLTVFMDSGFLVYEYNMLIIERFQARSFAPITPGEHVITVDTRFETPQPMAPAAVTLTVDGNEVGKVVVARTVPAAFTASETFGVGVDLGSPVSPDYVDRRPFRFTGTIDSVDIEVFAPRSASRRVPRPRSVSVIPIVGSAGETSDSAPGPLMERRPFVRQRRSQTLAILRRSFKFQY